MNAGPVTLVELEAWVASIEAVASGSVALGDGPVLEGRQVDASVAPDALESLEARLSSALVELARRRDEAGDELARLAARPR